MIDWLYKNRLLCLLSATALVMSAFIVQRKIGSSYTSYLAEKPTSRLHPVYEAWSFDPQNPAKAKALQKALEECVSLQFVYDPLIAQQAVEKDLLDQQRQSVESSLCRLEKHSPTYSAFSRLSVEKANDAALLEQAKRLQGSLKKDTLLYFCTLLQIIALEDRLGIYPHDAISALKSYKQKTPLFTVQAVESYLSSLEEKYATSPKK